ncbi:MAG: SUMF1/EgtB/PvdO family nonheme iron enzyme [Planctomycetes bacterium]|nr:SUMF1/EgtB/PvdO family nonheme iron enzyme [Planctomycetota bacterium]
MNRLAPVAAAAFFLPHSSPAQQLAPVATTPVVTSSPTPQATFRLRWPNSWHNERNHDGAWIVLRGPDATRGPLRLAAAGHTASGAVAGTVTASADGLGAFVAPAATHRGDVAFDVTLVLAEAAPVAVTAWTVGMVLVPAGAFELGDDDPLTLRFGAFHRVGADGAGPSPYPVVNEDAIVVAETPGALWYQGDRNRYRGDRGGPIPAAFPKGTRAFWVMKHELTQGEYAAFLNALPPGWRERRAPLVRTGEETATCSLELRDGRVVATAPDRPCNFVGWDDTCAYADWMALRPMTEFEFEKAARGPTRPAAGDYPWGTTTLAKMARRVQKTRDLSLAGVADEARLDDANRERFGASFYWVMDLSGSVWERVVSVGHAQGRAFCGSHGDGVLSAGGDATNTDWPRSDAKGENADGVGFRGGAEYFTPVRDDDPTNPCSRIATRTYAGWGGAARYKTYSARAVRSADQP